MFEVSNGVTKIDGTKGKFDNSASSPSAKYGKNAVDNFYSYMESPIINDKINPAPILDFGLAPNTFDNNAKKIEKFTKNNDDYLNSLPPLQFEYRYLPKMQANGQIDKEALIAAAKEEMDGNEKISVADLDNKFAPNTNYTSEALDINKDGYITNSEYATSYIAADMLSKNNPSPDNIDGTINKKGMNAILEYAKKSNAKAATELYSKLYNQYNLG